LSINGEAIYGTKPWKQSRQWTGGEQPKVDYNQEYKTPYDVSKLTEKPEPGKAGIDAFFTSKGSDVYAILPRWLGRQFTIHQFAGAKLKSATLLGIPGQLHWKVKGDSISVELPDLTDELLTQPAWVLKLTTN
jgi:alpha-L-fucosidase